MSSIGNYLEDSGAYVPIGSGWRKLRCPFHGDHTPSATVNHDAGRFMCFACGINEDLIGLIRLREGASYAEAKQKATQGFGEGDQQLSTVVDGGDWLPPRPRHNQRDGDRGQTWRGLIA